MAICQCPTAGYRTSVCSPRRETCINCTYSFTRTRDLPQHACCSLEGGTLKNCTHFSARMRDLCKLHVLCSQGCETGANYIHVVCSQGTACVKYCCCPGGETYVNYMHFVPMNASPVLLTRILSPVPPMGDLSKLHICCSTCRTRYLNKVHPSWSPAGETLVNYMLFPRARGLRPVCE